MEMKRGSRKLWMLPIVGLLAFAVASETADQAELAAALERWERVGARSYSYDYQILCYCAPEWSHKVRVEVVKEEIVGIVYAEDVYLYKGDAQTPGKGNYTLAYEKGAPVPDVFENLLNIDENMREIQRAMAEREPDEFEAVYDKKTGIVCRLYANPGPVDGEVEFVVSNFTFTPRRPELETGCAAGQSEFVHLTPPGRPDERD
ncbi:hypothetical protein BH24PSE2_BH24PSE2_11910 [soil metagenome]